MFRPHTRTCHYLVCSLLAIAFYSGSVLERADGAAPQDAKSRFPVAVVDMNRLFKEHRPFVAQLSELKREVAEIEKKIVVRRSEIQTVQNQLKGKTQGSEDHDNLQLLLARLRAEYKVFAEKQKAQLLERETSLYLRTYQALTKMIEEYAQANDIQLVLRVTKRSLTANKRESVMSWINRDVIYESNLDITDEILRIANAEPDA